MEKDTCNRLQAATRRARALLEQELGEQLEGVYDIRLNGLIAREAGAHLGPEARMIRPKLVAAVEHHQGTGHDLKAAVLAYRREAAFTTLNRFVALKMLEARKLVQECVSRGDQSSGFREFTGLAPGLVDLPDGGYRLYLECLFDELGREVRVLFDRRDPAGLLWPRRQALAELLTVLNAPDLADVWGEDETIGWVYQYFNGEDERRQMRAESQAPRDSRELAVRNQFFTPRYVVQFLTDNTLGRTWYEMRGGKTALTDQCEFMVRRTDEVFLSALFDTSGEEEGENGVAAMIRRLESGDEASFPPFIPADDDAIQRLVELAHCVNGYDRHPLAEGGGDWWWQTKQAMASAHTFDEFSTQDLIDVLFYTVRADRHGGGGSLDDDSVAHLISEEIRLRVLASRGAQSSQGAAPTPTLVRYRAPKDPRDLKILDPACGSGHFLLYAFGLLQTIYEEAWADDNTPAATVTDPKKTLREDYPDRDALRRAIPELILRHNLWGVDIDARCAQIAALALWMRAQRAYQEMDEPRGSRPQIRRSNIVVAEPMPGEPALRAEFLASIPDPKLRTLVERVFAHLELAGEAGSLLKIEEEIDHDIREVYGLKNFAGQMFAEENEENWERIEWQLLDALQFYGQQTQDTDRYRRRLFAEDAARGFAFVDMCRQQYDVVLMNPPFGACALPWKRAFENAYPRTKNDVYAAFVERGIGRLVSRGMLGAITSRTGFFLSSFQKWREEILLKEAPPSVFADLGYGVLDSAMVEVAAYCLE